MNHPAFVCPTVFRTPADRIKSAAVTRHLPIRHDNTHPTHARLPHMTTPLSQQERETNALESDASTTETEEAPSETEENHLKEGECPYCRNVKSVDCPVCDGRGYHGRTIVCYYCNGAKRIECPLCVDDIYKFSYVKRNDQVVEEEGDHDDDSPSGL